MKERIVRFGPANGLVGIVTEPEPARRQKDSPGIVFLNSGLLHRVGACRMHVRLARDLAGAGFTSIRFDFSGLGDSEARRDTLPFERSGILETREAMEILAGRTGAQEFILIGLCSGADMAFYTGIEDSRIIGIAQIDPFVYRTWRFYFHRYGPRLLRAESWLNLLRGRTYLGAYLRRKLRRNGAAESSETELVQSPYVRAFPPREQVAAGLRTLVERGVRLLNIFSSEQEEHYNYQGQYEASFRDVDFRGLLQSRFRRGASHIFSELTDQVWLDGEILRWVSSFLARPARSGAGDAGPDHHDPIPDHPGQPEVPHRLGHAV